MTDRGVNMKTDRIVIVQCRLSSTRLPGKALLPLGGKTVLDWVLAAMSKIPADYRYVATDEDSYTKILPVCERNNFRCFKGSLSDVLQRFVSLLQTVDASTVIRATADNPFLFYEAAEESVREFEERNKGGNRCDYLTFSGLPHGSGVEIFRADSLIKAAEQTSEPYDHEHVGPALYNHQDKFKCDFIAAPERYNHPELRTTIDTYSDYLRAQSVVRYLGNNGDGNPYDFHQILDALSARPVRNPLIFVPSVDKGHGTGHLHRCLSEAVRTGGFVYVPDDATLAETSGVIRAYEERGLEKNQVISSLPDDSYPAVFVTDAFRLSAETFGELGAGKIIISMDESSDFADESDYLLDVIPSARLGREPNLSDPGLIEKPSNVRQSQAGKGGAQGIRSVLVCLGGEDPAGLTMPAVRLVSQCLPGAAITAVCGLSDLGDFKNVTFTPMINNLRERLFEFDLVVTHYGLTAFEATCAGCRVILLPTTRLHSALAKKYGYASLRKNALKKSAFQKALCSRNIYPSEINFSSDRTLTSVLEKVSDGRRFSCPVCAGKSDKPGPAIARTASKTYRRCAQCGMVYLSFSCEEEMQYQKSYFFEDYKKQYGRTYEEDFDAIKSQGIRRLENIRRIAGYFSEKNILDVGCAFGPFLAAASEAGLRPFGTDISDDAVEYVQKKLGIPAVRSVFPDMDAQGEFGIHQFDIITMWFVIEHFKNLDEVLGKISEILKNDGIFAFSTPSAQGVSATRDRKSFFEKSPSDHFTVWEPSKCEPILMKYGFKVEKIVSTGHHPERFPLIRKKGAQKGSLLWRLTDRFSRIMRLGDTVEIYCRKIQK